MADRRGLFVLALIMIATAAASCGVVIGSVYFDLLDQHRQELTQAVGLQAQLLNDHAALLTQGQGRSPSPEEAEKLHRLLGADGRLAIGRLTGDNVTYLDNPWLPITDLSHPNWAPAVEEPMRRALAGERGSMVARPGNGAAFLTAFLPVPTLDVGIVASRDFDAIRGPLIAAATDAAAFALALILAGSLLFITLGNRTRRRLQAGERRFRELFENMSSGAAVARAVGTGEDFVLSGFNRGAERIEGLSRQHVLGRKISEVFPGARQGRMLEVCRRVWRTGQPEHIPPSHFADDDRLARWRESFVYRLPCGEVVLLFEDVTDRMLADDALKESEARWRLIIETHAQAIVIVDQKHEIRFVNKAAAALFGHSAQELIGAPFGFPLVQGDVAEIEIIRPGRSLAYGEMRAIPIRWSGQDNFLLFIQDVSAHKRAEGDLRKLFQAIEQSPASVMITDIEGRIEYVNPKFTETTGYTYPEVVGKRPGFLKSGQTSPEEYQELWKVISGGQVWRGEFSNRRKNGELFWELASIAPVRDGRGNVTHYVAVKEDISDRKATEERLRHSQRMETIGQLTGGIAHDFNNLLAIVLGNLQLLEERTGNDAENRELIADAIWSAERGAQLTHRLLAFARRQRLNPRIVDLNHIVEEMTGLLRRTLGERIEIREDLATGVGQTMIDRGQLENALLNLVVNARDAMPTGGVLTIATGTVALPGDVQTKGEEVSPGEYVVLTVTDTGVGMPPEVLERVFEPFFTTKKFGEGSGLGLSMVYGFVRQSGGTITMESQLGGGTVVRLYLPRALTTPDSEEHRTRGQGEENATREEVILVVEDDTRVRKTATSILRRHGYKVVEASDAGEALEAVDRLPRLDLLFTDIVLANGINGSELARQVQCRRPNTRILLTSGYADQVPSVESMIAKGVDLLPKPYRRNELTSRVRELLDRRSC